MNSKDIAISQISNFISSHETGLLLTGTHQYEKHRLVMRIINKSYNNAKILFRINLMQNITGDSFIGLKKQPKAGEFVKIGNNYYSFDSFNSISTWQKTDNQFDFAILYPIDALCRSHNISPLIDLFEHKSIGKIFLISWTDRREYDYAQFSDYFSAHVIFDAEDDDPEYHRRVLDLG